MRNKIFKFLYEIGVLQFFKCSPSDSVILCFHRIHPEFDPFTQPLSPDQFESIILKLKAEFTIVPLNAVLFKKKATNHKPLCCITFDDALLDFYNYSIPIIQKHKIPTTLFVPTESIENNEELYNYELAGILLKSMQKDLLVKWPIDISKALTLFDYLSLVDHYAKLAFPKEDLKVIKSKLKCKIEPIAPPMSWDQIREIKKLGIQIENHFHTHRWLPSLSLGEILAEISQSQKLLKKHVNNESNVFAYPMGGVNKKIETIMSQKDLIGLGTQNKTVGNSTNTTATHISRYNVSDRSAEELLFRIGGLHHLINHSLRRK